MWDRFSDSNLEYFKYFSNVKTILTDMGMDHLFHRNTKVDMNVYKDLSNDLLKTQYYNDINNYSSLSLYRSVTCNMNASDYLDSYCNFRGLQLKFKLRTGTLGLGSDLQRQHRGDGFCKCCNLYESAKHFIFVCPSYHTERRILYDNIIRSAGADVFSSIISNWDIGLNLLLGDHDDVYNNYFCSFIQKAWMIRSSHSNA